jgi:hypothetical protein
MELTETDRIYWESHNADEIAEAYCISRPTVFRAAKKYGLKIQRKPGSGSKPTGKEAPCFHCGTLMWTIPSNRKKYCSRVCMYVSNEYRHKLKTSDKSYMQTAEYSASKTKPTTPEYKKYAGKVHRLSHKVYESNLDILNPNGYNRTLCGVDGGYQLDHIVSIKQGYDNNIQPEIIARLENLRIIPWKDNLLKGSRELGE